MAGVLLEARPYRPFKSSEEYLYAMKEDLAEWLNMLYSDLELNVDNFLDKLETGVVLCKHANSVKKSAEEYVARKHLRRMTSSQSLTASLMTKTALPITRMGEILYRESAKPGTFFARDNVSNFIDFCRHGLEILECLLFETDDLIMRKNEKNVILCLLEVARRGAKFGMLAPILVQMEREIDREIAAEQRLASGDSEDQSSDDEAELVPYGPIPQIVTNDLKSLDEMVRDLVEKCTCPTQFPMIRVSEGKYRIGDTKILIFVRILRSHVMVRVGGGWDTLSHYLDKHDPCRCRTGHRMALSSKLILKTPGAMELNNAQVHYERSPPCTRRSSASSSSSGHGGRDGRDFLLSGYANRSRSPTPKRDNTKSSLQPPKYVSTFLLESCSNQEAEPGEKRDRSASPGGKRSYDAPTAASRNRSRSPSVRSVERQKKSINNSEVSVKQTDIKYLTAGELGDLGIEQSRRAKVLLEANELPNGDDSKQNDSGSEVSDEGYRSLGLIVTSPLMGEGKVVHNSLKNHKSGYSAHAFHENSELKECPNAATCCCDDDKQMVSVEEARKKRERKTVSREPSVEYSGNTLKAPSPSKTTSRVNSRSSSPARHSQSQTPIRRYSHMNESDSYRRSMNKENGGRKAPRSRSATSGRSVSESTQSSKQAKNVSDRDKFGTWNGKSKKRPGVHTEGYSSSNFVRNDFGRCSLGAGTTTYDSGNGRRTHRPKEQKNISPLLADLLKTKNLDDDKTILLKMKEIINQYSGIFDRPEEKFDSGLEGLDFTTEWVKNNGSIKRLEGGDADEKSSPSRRKDSKYEGPHSKIPAPVFFKQHVSEKECRI